MSQQPNNYTELIYRIGTFFLLVGIGLIMLFVFSEAAQSTTFGFFCWGMIMVVIGFMFRAQYKRTIPKSGRFSIFKRLQPKPKEDKGKK
jgi:hypothetical protein